MLGRPPNSFFLAFLGLFGCTEQGRELEAAIKEHRPALADEESAPNETEEAKRITINDLSEEREQVQSARLVERADKAEVPGLRRHYGPEPKRLAKDSHTKMGKPMFSCGWSNFAFGLSVAAGYVLDDRGSIWFYDLGRGWSSTPEGELFAGSGLRQRFAGARLMAHRPEATEFRQMLKKVEKARRGKVRRRNGSRDGGGSSCTAYIWEEPDAYVPVMLGEVGDLVTVNDSLEANELYDWLKIDLSMYGRPQGLPRMPRQGYSRSRSKQNSKPYGRSKSTQ